MDFEKGLPNHANYVEGQSFKTVKPLYKWGNGFYPGYKHCGRHCGNRGKYGGGPPRNPYDVCRPTHDHCCATYGTNDCQCDCNLIACAKKSWFYVPPYYT